ncbi:hypothetical protein BGZ73_002505, partial [Actinomortierella ambigua]
MYSTGGDKEEGRKQLHIVDTEDFCRQLLMLLYYGDRTSRRTPGMELARVAVSEMMESMPDLKPQLDQVKTHLQGKIPQCFFEASGRDMRKVLRETWVKFVPELVRR